MRDVVECSVDCCAHPVAREGTYLCKECSSRLAELMREVPWLREQLFVTMAKLDRVQKALSGGGGGSTGSAMPLRDLAMDKRRSLLFFEVSNVKEIARDRFAGGMFEFLQDLLRDGMKIIDQPETKIVWGTCWHRVVRVEQLFGAHGEQVSEVTVTEECGYVVVAPDDVRLTICGGCGSLLSKDEFEERQAERAWGQNVAPPMYPKDVCVFLREKLRISVTQKDIENWVKHGHLRGILLHVPADKVKPRKAYFPREVLATHRRMEDRKRAA